MRAEFWKVSCEGANTPVSVQCYRQSKRVSISKRTALTVIKDTCFIGTPNSVGPP
jgi:hypothetical protein